MSSMMVTRNYSLLLDGKASAILLVTLLVGIKQRQNGLLVDGAGFVISGPVSRYGRKLMRQPFSDEEHGRMVQGFLEVLL